MKNHLEIIKKLTLWENNNIEVEKLNGGITNFNYFIRDGKKKYVARFSSKSNILLGLNRKREIYNTKIAYSIGLGPKFIKFLPKDNLLLVEYMDGNVFSGTDILKDKQIKLLAKLLKKLHSGKKLKGQFNPFKAMREYIYIVKRKKSWLPKDINKLLNEFSQVEKKIGKFHMIYPCHLDVSPPNIIDSKNKIKLIDWEYSANSDFRFDLAMLSVMSNFSERQDKLLLKEYGIKDKDLYEQIQIMKAVVCFREASWGLLQMAISPIKFDYKKYAIEKFNIFKLFCRNF